MGPTTDEERRIRSYLQGQGAKLSLAEIVDKVRGAMREVHAAAAAVPADRFAERPSAGEWSANEVLAHVVDAGARVGEAIVRALDGGAGGPPLRDALEAGVPRRTAAAWRAQLERDREALFSRVLAADPAAHLDRHLEHPMFGPLNWRESLLFLRLHDLDHAGQLRAIATALG